MKASRAWAKRAEETGKELRVMESFRWRVEFANELDIKNVPFGCDELTIILSANSAGDVVLACLATKAIKTHFEHSPVLSEWAAPTLRPPKQTRSFHMSRKRSIACSFASSLHRRAKPTVLYAVVRPSSPVTAVRAAPSLALVAGTARSSPPAVGRASAP